MKEKDFQAEIARSITWLTEQDGRFHHYVKIPDIPRGPEQRFSPRRGYDCYVVSQGLHHALELKMSKGMSIAFDALDEYQEHQLMSAHLAGGRAFVVVNFRVTFSALERKRRGGEKTAILAFAVPIVTWQHWRSTDCRSSIPLAKMETDAIAIPRLRLTSGIGWDLRPLLVAP